MEIPRIWREAATNVSFTGSKKEIEGGVPLFKYPGGEILLSGNIDQIKEKFVRKGFKTEEIDEILFHLFDTITSEPAVSSGEVLESFLELLGSEVGK